MFTLVLRGHIDTAIQKFPDGIAGTRLDCISRMPLWNEGLDFGHGVSQIQLIHTFPSKYFRLDMVLGIS